MISSYQCAVLNIKCRKISFVRCLCLLRCVSLPLRFRPLLDQLRLGNRNCYFCTDSTFKYENLLTRADVQEYLRFISNECGKYVGKDTCENEVFTYINEVKNCENHLQNLKSLKNNNDEELDKLVKEEEEQFKNKIKRNYAKILSMTLPKDKSTNFKGAVIEVTPGVGGIEAKLFSEEIFEMYLKYIDFKGWEIDNHEKTHSETGGINRGEISVCGKSVYNILKNEAGIHRVQRIPITEKAGKVQTSTCKVHVLPQFYDNQIELNHKDLKIETMLSSGPGGQNVQKTETCVRIKHLPTGLSVESQEKRLQRDNIMVAIQKLKGLLYEREQRKKELEECELRKKQVLTVLRSDKIRTYNFHQNRVTDHRINHTARNVKLFMEGTSLLNELISALEVACKEDSLAINIARILKEKNVDEILKKKPT